MRFLIRLCCRLGFIVFKNEHYRFLGGRLLTNEERYHVEHKWIKFEMKSKRIMNGNHHA